MRLAWLLIANAIVVGIYGIVAVVFPGPLYDLYGGKSDGGSQFVTQLSGAALNGEAVRRFGMRNIAPGELRKTLLGAVVVEYAIGLAASLMTQLGGVTSTAGWMIVALFGLFVLDHGYFHFAAPNKA